MKFKSGDFIKVIATGENGVFDKYYYNQFKGIAAHLQERNISDEEFYTGIVRCHFYTPGKEGDRKYREDEIELDTDG